MPYAPASLHPAIVSRKELFPQAHESYLVVDPNGVAQWIDDPERATAFDSMREAARMALRLPAALKAFGVPLGPTALAA